MVRKTLLLVVLLAVLAPTLFAQTYVRYETYNGPDDTFTTVQNVNNLTAMQVDATIVTNDATSINARAQLKIKVDLNNNGSVDYEFFVNDADIDEEYSDSYGFPIPITTSSVRITHSWDGGGSGNIDFKTVVTFQ